jgi:chorismate mutase
MSETDHSQADLTSLRTDIEQLDRELVALIARRVALARSVGVAKRMAGLPTLDPAREAAIIRRASTLARGAGLGEEPVREIFWHLVGLCRRAQLEPTRQEDRD